jgi:hypothetical protein
MLLGKKTNARHPWIAEHLKDALRRWPASRRKGSCDD